MESLTKYIDRISRCTVFFQSGKLEHEGLTGRQYSYILRICKEPGISQEQLVKAIFIHKSNVTRQLALMEQNGFITRMPCENDKRVMRVYPTQKALDVYPKVKELLAEWNEYLCADLSEKEFELLISLLKRVLDRAVAKAQKELEND